jgi:hypothetical protein
MQSSTAIAFRALIMLIFLISVPLLAIFGKDLPGVIKGVLDGRLSVQVTEQPKPAENSIVAAPSSAPTGQQGTPLNPFAEPAPYRAPPVAADQTVPGTPPVPTPNNLTPAAGFQNAGAQTPPTANLIPPPGNLPPNGGTPAILASGTNPPQGMGQPQPPADWPALPPTQTQPDAFQPPVDTRPIHDRQPPQQPVTPDGLAGGSPNQTGDDKFRQAESRLRELGATQYILETWGAQNEQYRFTCRMAVGQSVGVTQHFEAVKADPWQAMQDVLRQVEDWQKQTVQ